MKFANVEAVGRLQIRNKNISWKGSSIDNIARFDLRKEQNLQ